MRLGIYSVSTQPFLVNNMKKYTLKKMDKLLREARGQGKVIVFNFSTKELEYANREWVVVNDLALS